MIMALFSFAIRDWRVSTRNWYVTWQPAVAVTCQSWSVGSRVTRRAGRRDFVKSRNNKGDDEIGGRIYYVTKDEPRILNERTANKERQRQRIKRCRDGNVNNWRRSTSDCIFRTSIAIRSRQDLSITFIVGYIAGPLIVMKVERYLIMRRGAINNRSNVSGLSFLKNIKKIFYCQSH